MERMEKALEVDRRLDEAFGGRLPPRDREVTLELIHAVLSQNTSRKNYSNAYGRLLERFPTVEEMAEAPVQAVEEAIRPGGLSKQKSRAIKEILKSIMRDRGDYSLDFLDEASVPEAREYLVSLPSVGPKTASIVLMFALGRKVLPVDTHVLRTSRRIGLIDQGTNATGAEIELEALIPPAKRPRMHLNLVRLGREVCRARLPLHEVCPVNMVCDHLAGGG